MIFGRAGTSLLPMLRDGADGLVAVMEEAKRLGLVMSTEDATAAAALTDAWTRLKSSLKMAVIQIGAALAPALQKLANWLTKIGRPLVDWIRQNKKLVVTVAAVAAGVMAGGAALIVLGTVISAAGTVVGALATGLSIVGSVLGALLSPMGLVVAAFGTILYKTGALTSALKWLGGVFRGLKDIATRAFKGIADAIAAGDLSLAIKIAGAAIKVVWAETMLWVRRQWTTAVFGIAAGLTNAWYMGLKTFTHVVNTMRVAWASFTTWAGNTWNKAQESFGTVFLDVLGGAGVLDEQELAIAKEELSGQMQKKIKARTAADQSDLAAIDREWEGKIAELDQQQSASPGGPRPGQGHATGGGQRGRQTGQKRVLQPGRRGQSQGGPGHGLRHAEEEGPRPARHGGRHQGLGHGHVQRRGGRPSRRRRPRRAHRPGHARRRPGT